MTPETTRLKLWRIDQTDKAMKFQTMPPGDPGQRTVWIPRSVIHHVSVNPHKPSEPQPCIVDVEAWFAEKERL